MEEVRAGQGTCAAGALPPAGFRPGKFFVALTLNPWSMRVWMEASCLFPARSSRGDSARLVGAIVLNAFQLFFVSICGKYRQDQALAQPHGGLRLFQRKSPYLG